MLFAPFEHAWLMFFVCINCVFSKKKFQKQNFYFSDDVQLSSEAMGVYELQASPKFKSFNELTGLGGN